MNTKRLYFQALFLVVSSLVLNLWPSEGYTQYDNNYQSVLLTYEKEVWNALPFQFSAIEQNLISHIQKYPHSAFGYYLLSLLYLKKFLHTPQNITYLTKAQELAQQSYELNPTSDFALVALANYLDVIGESHKACNLIEQAFHLKIEPSWRIYFSLGRIKMNISNTTKANILSLFKQALGFNPTQPDIIIPYLVKYLEQTTSSNDLIAELDKYQKIYNHYLFDVIKAKALEKSQSFYQAHLLYEKTYQKYPQLYEYKILDAIILNEKLNQPQKAQQLLGEILNTKDIETHLSKEELILVNLNLGLILTKEQKFNQGYKYIYTAIKNSFDPQSFIMHVANFYKTQKYYKELLEFLHKIKYDVLSSALIFAIEGEILSEHLKDYSNAIKSYSNAILLEPDRSEFYNGLGIVYYKMKNIDAALQQFQTSIKINPYDATAWYNKACMLALKNQLQEALSALEIAISLNPSLQETAKKDVDFALIKKNSKFIELISNAVDNSHALPEIKDTPMPFDEYESSYDEIDSLFSH